MATLLYRLGKTAYRRWPVFIAAWLVALIGVAALAGTVSKPMVDTLLDPGHPLAQGAGPAEGAVHRTPRTPRTRPSVTVVVAAPEGHTSAEPAYVDQRRRPGRRPRSPCRRCRGRSWPTRCRRPTRSTSRPSRAPRSPAARPTPPRAERQDAVAAEPGQPGGHHRLDLRRRSRSPTCEPATQEKLLDVAGHGA